MLCYDSSIQKNIFIQNDQKSQIQKLLSELAQGSEGLHEKPPGRAQQVQNGSGNHHNLQKQLNELQKENRLNPIITSLMSVQDQYVNQKNVALTELISLLKGQMFQFQKRQKQQQELSVSQSQKRIKKIQYDIQQILQKHNEQIAKINSLKEEANCCRSQRVVFSNLFKKLEKELKQNEESYKQNLMKSQVAKDKVPTPVVYYKYSTKSLADEDQQCYRPTLTKKTLFVLQNQPGSQQQQTFVTLQRHPSQTTDFKLNSQKRRKLTQKQEAEDHLDIKMTSKGFNQMITCYQTFLQQLKVAIGYSDSKEIIDHYEKLEQKNQNLTGQVQAYNNQIIKLSHLTQQIQRQKKSSQCYEYSKDFPLGSMRRIRAPTKRSSICEQPEDIDQVMTVLGKLSLTLKICPQQDSQISEQKLKEMDYKLDQIILQCKAQNGQTQNLRQLTQISQTNVDILLQRMQKFNECEKLLDLPSLKQEYTKQVGKCKKMKNKK